MNPGKNFIANVLLAACGLIAALGACELLIRLTGAAPEVVYIEKWRMRLASDPKIGYEPIPFLNAAGQSFQYYGYQGTSNSLGFRDREHPIEKAKGTKRILVIGDSVTAGLWIRDDADVFPVVMEKELLKKGLPAEVMNFGVLGYNTQQEVETLRSKGLKYKPDLVVLAYCLNDRTRDDGGIYGILLSESKKIKKIDRSKAPLWVAESAFVRFLCYRVFPLFRHVSPKEIYSSDANLFAKDTVEEYFGVLKQLSAENHFKVAVVVFPNLLTIESGKDYDFLSEHETIRKLSAKHGFSYLDLLPVFRECKASRSSVPVSFDRYHPRPLGYHCAGKAIAEFVADLVR